MRRDGERVGVWLVGGRGSVSTTAMVGAAAIVGGAAEPIGMVTSRPPFDGVGLPGVDALVFGGQDVVATPLVKRAEQLAVGGVLPANLLSVVEDRLEEHDGRIVAVPTVGSESVRESIDRMVRDLEAFRSSQQLDQVVVINLASTEPAPGWESAPRDAAGLDAALDAGWQVCTPTVVAAVAALRAGCGFVDFTPGAAVETPAIQELARERGLPLAGRDGKTGETLLKTVLAPMFADRALKVRSWAGTNLLGGGDGAALADPVNAASKLESKSRSLDEILPDEVVAPVHIDCVPDLGEWKTAWNHIHFEGFLGVAMTLQVTWQGCDSALAAPLVLDLARLVAFAQRRGDAGPLTELGFYFKDPVASDEHRLSRQYLALQQWATGR